jgi:hypothetical protein
MGRRCREAAKEEGSSVVWRVVLVMIMAALVLMLMVQRGR